MTIQQLMVAHPNAQDFNIIIGPEGGFRNNEMILALQSCYDNVALGPRILRTETAPVAICAILQTLWGDF